MPTTIEALRSWCYHRAVLMNTLIIRRLAQYESRDILELEYPVPMVIFIPADPILAAADNMLWMAHPDVYSVSFASGDTAMIIELFGIAHRLYEPKKFAADIVVSIEYGLRELLDVATDGTDI